MLLKFLVVTTVACASANELGSIPDVHERRGEINSQPSLDNQEKEKPEQTPPEQTDVIPEEKRSTESEGDMGTIAMVTKTIETNLGVGSGAAQALAWVFVLSISYMAIQLVQSFFGGGSRKRRSRGQKLLIIGQNGAGKTSLFFRLRDADAVNTVSSLKPLRDTMKIKIFAESVDASASGDGGNLEEDSIGPVEVIDFPGHNRLRGKLAELLWGARCIVYVIDSEDKAKLKDAAEHLYELFTHRDMCELQTPILLALNKIDLPSARTEKFVIEELDREIEQMRVSRNATLEGQDQADSYLGVDGEKFKLLEHSPCPIETCRVSVKKPQLQPVYDFLRQHFA